MQETKLHTLSMMSNSLFFLGQVCGIEQVVAMLNFTSYNIFAVNERQKN